MTRLENIVCALLRQEIIRPPLMKVSLRVFGDRQPHPMTLPDYEKLSNAVDSEFAERVVSIARDIEKRIADIELKEIDSSTVQCSECTLWGGAHDKGCSRA